MAIPAPLIALGKALLLKKVTREIERKFDDIPKVGPNDEGKIIELVDTVEAYAIDEKKAGGWVTVASALVSFAAASGWLGADAQILIMTILSDPEAVEAIEGVVD